MKNKYHLFVDWQNILTVIGNDIYVTASYYIDDGNEPNEFPECVGIMTKKQYYELLEIFFKEKADYYKLCKHFCGHESVWSDDVVKLKTECYLNKIDNTKDVDDKDIQTTITVPTFRMKKVEIEMEHG